MTLRERWTFKNAQGLYIRMYHERPPRAEGGEDDPPTRGILLLHGLKSHYEMEYCTALEKGPSGHKVVPDSPSSWSRLMVTEEGLAVFGMDYQGHGESDNWRDSRTNVEHFDHYADDVIMALGEIHKRHPGLPLCLAGISLGGAIACRTLELIGKQPKPTFNLKSAVLMCPAISIELLKAKPTNRILLPFAGLISTLGPLWRIGAVEDHPFLPELNEYIKADKKSGQGNIPARLAHEAIAICDTVFEDSEYIGRHDASFELSVIHARGDGYVDYGGSERMINKVQLTNKTLHTLEAESGMWHYLTLEPGTREHVLPHVMRRIPAAPTPRASL